MLSLIAQSPFGTEHGSALSVAFAPFEEQYERLKAFDVAEAISILLKAAGKLTRVREGCQESIKMNDDL
jgi:hypothetical protein